MNPSISIALETMRASLASSISASVLVGAPDGEQPGLYLFPLQYESDPHLTHRAAPPTESDAEIGFSLDCLMLAEPAGDLSLIDQGLAHVEKRPVEHIDGAILRCTVTRMTTPDLAAVFDAARIRYRMAVALRIRIKGTARD